MKDGLCIGFLLSVCLVLTSGITPTAFLSPSDQARLIGIFRGALLTASDGPTLHYAIKGLKAVGGDVGDASVLCAKITEGLDAASLESLYHAASAGAALACPPSLDDGANSLLTGAIADPASMTGLFHAVMASSSLGLQIDDNVASASLSAALKKDDGPLAMGYSFHIAAALGGDLKKFYDNIEDIVAQADEVDGRFLQFEGGLFTSAVVVDGAHKLAAAAGADSVCPASKIVKMANYFVSRKNVHHVKSASWMLTVIKTLTSNSFHNPVVIRRASAAAIPTAEKKVAISATDLMGASLGPVTVTADALAKKGDSAAIMSKVALTPISDDGTLFELDFSSAGNDAKRGFYKVTLSVEKIAGGEAGGVPLVGNTGAEVDVTVITEVGVENVEIGIADRDQSVAPKTTRVQYPNKVPTMLEVDSQQKVIMKFSLKDVTDPAASPLLVHQAFVRLTHRVTGKDVFFVADVEPGTGVYKFDMDVGASAKEFASQSGKYAMCLVVGDALIANPVAWELVEVRLTFQGDPAPASLHLGQYDSKPEIEHLFRVPEKRPPRTVSLAFTGLIILPLLLLLLVWKMMGANVDALSSRSPLDVGMFHGTLGAVLVLMYLYWTQLDMFVTLKYLTILSIVLFLSGNRLLAAIAATRKAK